MTQDQSANPGEHKRNMARSPVRNSGGGVAVSKTASQYPLSGCVCWSDTCLCKLYHKFADSCAYAQPAPEAPESRSRDGARGGTGEELSNPVAERFKSYAKDVLARHASPQRFGDGRTDGAPNGESR